MIFVTLFWAVFFLWGGWNAHYVLRLRGLAGNGAFPVTPALARAIWAGLLGLSVTAIILPMVRLRAMRWRLTDEALICHMGQAVVVWPHASLTDVALSPFFIWYRLSFAAEGPARRACLIGGDDARHVLAILDRVGVPCERPPGLLPAGALAPGERALWQGRPGLATFDGMRGLCAMMAIVPALLLALWLWAIWDVPRSVPLALFWTLVAFGVLGATVIAILAAASVVAMAWLYDMLGQVMVTDRRIIWRAPLTGRVYREIAARDIGSVDLVALQGKRGWLSLSLKGATDDDAIDRDLVGMPEPEAALAAIRALIARP
ncbi:hypothetical protein [Sphingobium aquiterrae]|uniref:hypothetical protein n=1 Tax=Sphingobium aquiterrae TaxID=2038656 RepID=UPI0030174E1B